MERGRCKADGHRRRVGAGARDRWDRSRRHLLALDRRGHHHRGNADLWTAEAGYNQDLGIFVSADGGTPQPLAWEESAGFAGTFSPDAVLVETAYPVTAGNTYVFSLWWKTNRSASPAVIYAGAGPPGGPSRPAVWWWGRRRSRLRTGPSECMRAPGRSRVPKVN